MVGDRYSCGIWRKSTRSGAQSNCVEARFDGTTVWLHNSNNPSPRPPPSPSPRRPGSPSSTRFKRATSPPETELPTLLAGLLLIGFDGEHITVRDNDTPTVHYTLDEWHAFLDGVTHDGEFTLPWLLGIPANA